MVAGFNLLCQLLIFMFQIGNLLLSLRSNRRRFLNGLDLSIEAIDLTFELVHFSVIGNGDWRRCDDGRDRNHGRDNRGSWRRVGHLAADSIELIGDIFQTELNHMGIPIRRVFMEVAEDFGGRVVFLKSRSPV